MILLKGDVCNNVCLHIFKKLEYCIDDPLATESYCVVYQGRKLIKNYLKCIRVYVADTKVEPKCTIALS
jgi:hypothetical protein